MSIRKVPFAGATRWSKYNQATDHGALAGLTDDDHTGYALADGTRSFTKVVITSGAGAYLEVPELTTAQRDALSASEGMLLYNSDDSQFQGYENGAWGPFGGVTLHDMGGSSHDADTFANLNTKVSDATLLKQGDTLTANLDVGGYELQNPVIHTKASEIEMLALAPVIGKMCYRTDDEHLYFCWSESS